MRKLQLTIDAGSVAVKAFKILKAFDASLELGPSLACIRNADPIIEVHAHGVGAVSLLGRMISLLDDLDRAEARFVLKITDGIPEKKEGQPPVWPTRIGNRRDLVDALQEEQLAEQRIAEQQSRQRAWAASPEGKEYFETQARLDNVRDFLRDRWDSQGFDDLHSYEKDYLYAWWLCVETTNGGLDQYFYNSTGDSALLALTALEAIGALKAHAILHDALAIFASAGGFSPDRLNRQNSMSTLPSDAFDDVTRRFYDLSEDIRALALQRVEDRYQDDGVNPKQQITTG